MIETRTAARTVASAAVALLTALLVTFANVGTSDACGTYGMDDETLVEWAVADHLAERDRQNARRASADAAHAPTWKVADVDTLGGRLALARVVFTSGQHSYSEYFTLVRIDRRWQLVRRADLVS